MTRSQSLQPSSALLRALSRRQRPSKGEAATARMGVRKQRQANRRFMGKGKERESEGESEGASVGVIERWSDLPSRRWFGGFAEVGASTQRVPLVALR